VLVIALALLRIAVVTVAVATMQLPQLEAAGAKSK